MIYIEYQKLLLGDEPYFIALVKASYPQQHCHNEVEIIYCLHGEVRIVVDEKEYILCENDVLFIDSLAMHEVFIEEDALFLDIEFGTQFVGTYFSEFVKYSFSEPLLNKENADKFDDNIKDLLQKIYFEQENPDIANKWAMRGYLNELFATIVRTVPRKKIVAPKQKNLDRYLRIQNIFEFVKCNYSQQITLNDAANHVGYDPNAFCRLFKTITNMSFHQYLNVYRINVAMRLLEYNAYSIGEIGQMVGIPVAKTFGRVFKKYTGMTPREYRHRIYNNND